MSEPMVNVNLSTNCGCIGPNPGFHLRGCSATAVNIPCPLPPSVEMKVVLGECMCQKSTMPSTRHWHPNEHPENCPARPVRVTCSISGETWAGSEAAACRVHGGHPTDSAMDTLSRCMAACRDLWALFKALVTGEDAAPYMLSEAWAEKWDRVAPLFAQRDAVFSALVRVATMERVVFDAQGEYASAMDEHQHPDWHRDPESYEMPSQKMLALYVWRLFEQVGALGLES